MTRHIELQPGGTVSVTASNQDTINQGELNKHYQDGIREGEKRGVRNLLEAEADVDMYAEANQELIEELAIAKGAAKLSDDVARKLNGTVNELDSQVYQLKQKVERLEKQRNTLANNYDGHLASCKDVFEKLDSFERQAAAAGKQGVEWMRRHDEVKVENEALWVQLSTCKGNWEAKNDEAVRLTERVELLKLELEGAYEERDQLSAGLQAADQNYADLQRMVGRALRIDPYFNTNVGPF
jgi:chromosome segregation ATPase